MPRNRERPRVQKDDTDEGLEEVTEYEVGAVDEEVAEAAEETTLSEQPAEPVEMRLVGPFRAEGCNVLDAAGQRVAICGYDHNRVKSGPGVAEVIASSLNRTVR